MIGEIALLIKGLDTACKLVKTGLDRKKDIESMSSEIGSFFASKKEVEEKIAEVKRNQDGYAGSALEEAIQIEQQNQAVQRNAAKIQKERDSNHEEANRRKIIRDRKNDDFYLAAKLIVGLVILMIAITGLIFTLAIN